MLRMKAQGGKVTPLLLCDICSSPITDAHQASIVFDGDAPIPSWPEAIVVHNDTRGTPCFSDAKKMMRDKKTAPATLELTSYFAELFANMGISTHKLAVADEYFPSGEVR